MPDRCLPCADHASDSSRTASGHHNSAHRDSGSVEIHRGDVHADSDLQDSLLLLLPSSRVRLARGRDQLTGSLCSGEGHLHTDGAVLPGVPPAHLIREMRQIHIPWLFEGC